MHCLHMVMQSCTCLKDIDVPAIRVVSWNINGVSNKVKRYKIISHLKSLSCDVAMLQETHLNENESLKLRQRWVGQVFSAPGNGASRGTSILISKKISFHHTDVIVDNSGRYIIVSGILQHKKITLINIYAPNSGQVEFLSKLALLASKFVGDPIVGGDMNLLYESECRFNPDTIDDFLRSAPLPQLKEDDRTYLEKHVQELKVKAAIKALAAGKAPGQDGFSVDFYKCFQEVLSPFLTLLYRDIIATQSTPQSMNMAVISLSPKPGKDHTKMDNFRPLSLLNNDYKIFAKTLAMRLEKVISSLIHLDQVGFIAGRYSAHNMRRLFHVMSEAASLQHPAVAISLDAEKAFDRIEWSYLFHILTKYGFGPVCIQWIKALYHNPVACVKTNGLISPPFHLFRSTRQGCPASPVIFTLALEPLACAIRENQSITGIKLFNYDFKANLYADDILLTLSRPALSVPNLLKLISDFGVFSGYKINCSTPIVWKTDGMRYLGVNITSPIDNIFELNGPKLLKTVRDDLNRWTNLPLSLWGRAEVLKMNVQSSPKGTLNFKSNTAESASDLQSSFSFSSRYS
uniref:Reverse transcriptase domain-containing protein n=1 Tax=Gadus morhua TaxID=8049 RepID=A0A8C5FMU7_GADMO